MTSFAANCLPLLIGSLPHKDHLQAAELIFDFTPHIPLWPQLPFYKEEGMVLQYIPGMPGVTELDGKVFIDAASPSFETEVLAFYEEYLLVTEGGADLDGSRFILSPQVAQGFYKFLEMAGGKKNDITALKGQTTGPITFCTGLVDQAGRAIFYDDQLRDVAVKHLALKAGWQVKKMMDVVDRAIMFFDEPALAGLGSSAFITISQDEIVDCFKEVFAAVRAEDGLCGVHVCANTEWSVIFESDPDIVSYDAYSFFDKLILYPNHLRKFFGEGGVLATGIIPTSSEFIDIETTDSLTEKWLGQKAQLEKIGIDEKRIYEQTLITPSCGTGTIADDYALKVLELTRDVSEKIRLLI